MDTSKQASIHTCMHAQCSLAAQAHLNTYVIPIGSHLAYPEGEIVNLRGVVISNPTLTGQWKHLEMHFILAQNKYEDMLFAEIHTVLCTVHSALQDELSCRVAPL